MPTTFRAAFALPKEEVLAAQPFGTVKLSDGDGDNQLRLVPLPSSDPQDPLNWPRWLKVMSLLCMSSYAFVTNFASASIASAFPLLATPLGFNKPLGELGYMIAVNVLMIGVANFWWVPLASVLGRRPIILFNLALLAGSSAWAASTRNYGSFMAARCFMGIGGAPADTVAPTILGEIFFVHERGKVMGVYSIMLALGPLTGGLSGGYLAARMGIPWINWLNTILAGTLFLACCIFQPETLFARSEEAEANANNHIPDKEEGQNVHLELAGELSTLTPIRPTLRGPFSLTRALSVSNYNLHSICSKFAAPWLTLRLPGVWVSMLWHAGLVGAVVAISTVGPSIVAHPPYLWGSNAGLINVGGIIGVVTGLCMTALLADRVLGSQARKSIGGIAEAEGRLLVAVPGLVLATTGIWTFGFCAAHPTRLSWLGMQFGYGMLGFGLTTVPAIGFNYVIEAYGPQAADCFVAVTGMRSAIGFCWTFFVASWADDAGADVPFGIFGGIMGAFALLIVPLWLWGKRMRIATEEWVV
ncbi:major facilitator superfamily domain-containing protein [Aspergillus granulosus]|uniref:Major facilitator superfamily domain-containing protein n=1 Tax=Aspergillus granulosus TaxID=176169 RepID=A0ABR4H7X7_9EURO